jgi:hypothetical protein
MALGVGLYDRYEEVKPMTTITLTPEQLQLVEQAGDQPVRVEDPRNHRIYLLVEESAQESHTAPIEAGYSWDDDIPEGILRSQDAFFRDLPELLKDESLRGQWVIYHGDERIGIAPSDEPLIRECLKRGLKRDEYDVFVIRPKSREPEVVEIVTPWV